VKLNHIVGYVVLGVILCLWGLYRLNEKFESFEKRLNNVERRGLIEPSNQPYIDQESNIKDAMLYVDNPNQGRVYLQDQGTTKVETVPLRYRPDKHPTLRKLFNALWQVESSKSFNPKDGDGGKAIGPYQIHYVYWYDATHNVSGKKVFEGEYQDCRNKDYAEQIMVRYWTRFCSKAVQSNDYEILARTHNGGPSRKGTNSYWLKVKNSL